MPLDLAMRNDIKVAALEEEDPKLVTLWIYLLCMMYEEKGPLEANYKRLAYLLRFPTEEEVRHVVEDSGLFILEDGVFWNASAMERIERKDAYIEQQREAGRRGGRPRKSTPESDPFENDKGSEKGSLFENKSDPFENDKGLQKANKSNKRNQRKEINQRAGAQAPTREEEDDFLIEKFFFRNMMNPGREVGRCLEHYADGINDIEAVGKKWAPQDTAPRFDDRRCLEWARVLWALVGTAANRHEAAECLRHIDALEIDRGKNSLKVRMRGRSWAEAVAAMVADNNDLRQGFEEVNVFKRAGT